MRITRVYTRGGDAGQTSLATGERIDKDDLRVESYGTVDELNAVIGVARACLAGMADRAAGEELDDVLARVQSELFQVGAELASPDPETLTIQRVGTPEVERLEGHIDRFNEDLKPLEEFVLPGGGPCGARLHHARVVCRRAERRTVTLGRETEIAPGVLKYLNRLSDLLFVLARWACLRAGEREVMWSRPPGAE